MIVRPCTNVTPFPVANDVRLDANGKIIYYIKRLSIEFILRLLVGGLVSAVVKAFHLVRSFAGLSLEGH